MEKKILDQFKKKMRMENRNDLIITLDVDEWGEFLNEAIIMEPHGKVWNITTYSTGRILSICEVE